MTGSGGPTSPHKRYRQGDDELRLLIPSKVAGSIIGKGGQNITKLRTQVSRTAADQRRESVGLVLRLNMQMARVGTTRLHALIFVARVRFVSVPSRPSMFSPSLLLSLSLASSISVRERCAIVAAPCLSTAQGRKERDRERRGEAGDSSSIGREGNGGAVPLVATPMALKP